MAQLDDMAPPTSLLTPEQENTQVWRKALDMIRRFGVAQAKLCYVSSEDQLCEAAVPLTELNEGSLEHGIIIEDGTIVYPNPNAVMCNPYNEDPVVVIVCDRSKERAVGMGRIHARVPENEKARTPLQLTSVPQLQPGELQNDAFQSPDFTPVSLDLPFAIPALPPTAVTGGAPPAIASALIPPPDASLKRSRALPRERRTFKLPYSTETAPASSGAPVQIQSLHGTVEIDPQQRGASCHQCKNARTAAELAFCAHKYAKRNSKSGKMAICRKKFCGVCLAKFYNIPSVESVRTPDWICPSCLGVCQCAGCLRKNKGKVGALYIQQQEQRMEKGGAGKMGSMRGHTTASTDPYPGGL